MRWYVKLPNGDIEPMTLDELDAAYENGVVDSSTLILAPEARGWAQLGELAAGDDSPAIEPAAPPGPIELIPIPPPARSRSRWMVPLAVASIALAAFVAAGFEARQAGAFSSRKLPVPEAPSPPRRAPPPEVVADSVSAGVVDLPSRAPRTIERRSKRSPSSPGPTPTVSPSAAAGVFTSGGKSYDPLNADLP